MLGAFYQHTPDLVRGICDKTPTFRFLFYKNKAESRSLIYILNENTSLTCNIPQRLVFCTGGAEQHNGPLIPHTWGALPGGTPQTRHKLRAAGPAPPAPRQGPTRFSVRDEPEPPAHGQTRRSGERCPLPTYQQQLRGTTRPVLLFPLFSGH